jgi:predicted RNase H-like HicB family nuclease
MIFEIFFAVDESPEGGYEVVALNHSIYTEADTLPELRAEIQDAVMCHFESESRPELIRLHFVREEVLVAA